MSPNRVVWVASASAVAVVGCGGAQEQAAGTTPASVPRVAVAPAGTVGAIRAALGRQAQVADGGVWFADPICRARFAKPRRVEQVELDGFAKCLGALAWAPEPERASMHDDTAVVTYAPGFELELHVPGGALDFVGFSGRGAGIDETPMITPTALELLRTAGTARPTIAGAPTRPVSTHLRVCLDAAGAATVTAAQGYLPATEAAFEQAAADWRFKPFTVGSQAIAACAIVMLRAPADDATLEDRIPLPPKLDAQGRPIVFVDAAALRRTGGMIAIVPDDVDKTSLEMQHSGNHLAGDFELCLDERGAPTDVTVVHSTGIPTYDARIVRTVRETWRYAPYERAGKAAPVCVRFGVTWGLERDHARQIDPAAR